MNPIAKILRRHKSGKTVPTTAGISEQSPPMPRALGADELKLVGGGTDVNTGPVIDSPKGGWATNSPKGGWKDGGS